MLDIDFSKYEDSVIKNIDKDNVNKIISFLNTNGCDFIDELLEDYLDIFTFEYDDFINRYNKLNIKYNNDLINAIKNDMNILEEFYY